MPRRWSLSAPARRASRLRAACWRPTGGWCCWKPLAMSAGAASPTPRTFGVPYDRGAHWHSHARHQSGGEACHRRAGSTSIRRPPASACASAGAMPAKAEMEDLFAALVRAKTAIADARAQGRRRLRQALPKDLGDWRATVEFILGPYGCGKDLTEISAVDFARSAERDVDAFCRQGLGTLLTRLATGLPVQLSTPVTRIGWGGRSGVEVETAQGQDRRARRHRHRLDRRARVRQDQVHARSAQAPARRRAQGSSSAATIM